MIIKVPSLLCSFLLAMTMISTGCNSNEPVQQEAVAEQKPKGYKSGIYCADVGYYNPNTGTRKTYTLNVEVEDNEVVKILFNNGGWLDDSHMRPEALDEDGECALVSDKGYQYSIKITGSECPVTSTIEPEKAALTLAACCLRVGMTEEEISQYEKNINVSRTDIISEEMCSKIAEYLPSLRKKIALDKAMEDGYIQKTYIQKNGDFPVCNFLIVKRRGSFYLLEVAGNEKSTMGLMQFDPENSGWQDVLVQEDPAKMELNGYKMRIVDQNTAMQPLESSITYYCNR